jgi:thiamine phosphate synthase YjbQ (UPF0047 family)
MVKQLGVRTPGQGLHDVTAQVAALVRPFYQHDTEGPDDMPAHIKAALTATSLAIPTGSIAA